MLAISEHRARCRTNRAGESLLAARSCSALFLPRLLGSRARSAYQPGGCCSAWVLDYNCFFPKSEKFVWVLKKCIGMYHPPFRVGIARYSGHCSAFLQAGLLGPLARSAITAAGLLGPFAHSVTLEIPPCSSVRCSTQKPCRAWNTGLV